MPPAQLSGLPRAPHLPGLPAASRQGGTPAGPVTVTQYRLLSSGSVTAPATGGVVIIEMWTRGADGLSSGQAAGAGGGYGRKTRRFLPGEIITATLTQSNGGAFSCDGMTGVAGTASNAGGTPGYVIGGDENRTGGKGAPIPGGGPGAAGGSSAGPGANGLDGSGITTTFGAALNGAAGYGGAVNSYNGNAGYGHGAAGGFPGGGGGGAGAFGDGGAGGLGVVIMTFIG